MTTFNSLCSKYHCSSKQQVADFLATRLSLEYFWLCIKMGQGQGDGNMRTRAWGLGTWGRVTRDLRRTSMGREDVLDGDARTSKTGTQGTRDVNDNRKSRR